MSLAKAKRKIKRAGKTAVQFRITSTFEFIELECKGTWRPERLSVVWQRSHRKVKSNEATWTVSDDFGPNGAKGKGVFTPAIAVSLVVTLYRDAQHTEFDEKEYKYYIQNEGPSGKKILASFNCNVADFVAIPSTKHALDLNFKCVSKKVSMAKLGITLESQFMKEGGAMDDDMQSTFSAISTGQESVTYEDEEEEDEDQGNSKTGLPTSPLAAVASAAGSGSPRSRRLGTLREEAEENAMEKSLVLGTGQHVKRETLPNSAPAKPPRPRSVSPMGDIPFAPELNPEPNMNSEPDMNSKPVTSPESNDMTSGPNMSQEPVSNSVHDGNQGNGKAGQESEQLLAVAGSQQSSSPAHPLPEITVSKFERSLEVTGAGRSPEERVAPIVGDQKAEEPSAKCPASVHPEPQVNSGPVVENGQPAAKESVSAVEDRTKADLAAVSGGNEGRRGMQESPRVVEAAVERGGAAGSTLQSTAQQDAQVQRDTQLAARQTKETIDHTHQSHRQEDRVEHRPKDFARQGNSSGEGTTEKASTVCNNGTDTCSSGKGHEQAASGPAQGRSNPGRKTVESIETYTPPANPYYQPEVEEDANEANEPHHSHTEVWLEREAQLVDCFGEVVSREKLEQADLIGLYFSAGWCPPCRRFLPKLIKFYHHLKQHGKAFEILYISSDYSKQDMMKYMKEQQMPWAGISYEGNVSDNFRKKYNVSAVPLFTLLGRRGDMIEDSAKRSVEGATSGASILKLYNKWHEKMMMAESSGGGGGGEEGGRIVTASNQKKGILSKVRASIHKPKDVSEQPLPDTSSPPPSPPKSSPELGRRVLDTRVNRKTKGSKGTVSAELLEEKEERIQHLEEVNRTLKQTNDELSEELGELRQKYEATVAELEHIKSTSKTLQEESKELIANLNMRGWLYKRGVRGPTASIWRRRYFRLDQGSKLYYYKNSSEGNPQGFIDVDKVISVQEVTASQQDKNHATFTVQCEGRTFQLLAHDEPSMRKWMEAILYMTNWRKKNSRVSVEDL